MTTSKSTLLLLLLLASVSGFAQNQQFYWGFSLGTGFLSTNLNADDGASTGLGVTTSAEFSVNYRLNDTWGLEMYIGHQGKTYRFSAVNYYRDRFYNLTGRVDFKDRRSNLVTGLNLSFRQPVNVQKSIYLGGLLGYGRNWYRDQWSGENLVLGSCRDESGIINGCKRIVFQEYAFRGRKNDYLSTGAFVEFNLPIKDLEAFNILRFSAIKRTGLGANYPLQGTMTLSEEGERIDEFTFSSKGSTITLEIAVFLLM